MPVAQLLRHFLGSRSAAVRGAKLTHDDWPGLHPRHLEVVHVLGKIKASFRVGTQVDEIRGRVQDRRTSVDPARVAGAGGVRLLGPNKAHWNQGSRIILQNARPDAVNPEDQTFIHHALPIFGTSHVVALPVGGYMTNPVFLLSWWLFDLKNSSLRNE